MSWESGLGSLAVPNQVAPARAFRRGLLVLGFALLPTLGAVWLLPGYGTQDGPAHVYNASLILGSLQGDPRVNAFYDVRWQPLPNWTGHLALVGLLAIMPAWAADKVMISATLTGFAISLLWLRYRVAGDRGIRTAALMCALLAMNFPWLLGFYSFLLGTAIGFVTLGAWWGGRERLGPSRLLALGALLVLGYFSHLISLGLTLIGLLTLAVLTPGERRGRRLVLTIVALLPLLPLGLAYRTLMNHGGAISPHWMELTEWLSLDAWRKQLGWVDPLSLAGKVAAPFLDDGAVAFALVAPILLFALALTILTGATVQDKRTAYGVRQGWAVLAAVFVVGGIVGPDSLGPKHGNYLALRVFLFGLASVVPLLELGGGHRLHRAGTGLLMLAVIVQSAFVWDFGLRTDRQVSAFLRAKPHLGTDQRVVTLLLDLRQKFRSNPLLHVDNWLGVGTGNVIWTNYETAFYYFPVQVLPDVPHPDPLAIENISIRDDPAVAPERARAWESLLEAHHSEIDVLVVWGDDPSGLDPITTRWFTEIAREGKVRVLRRREPSTGRPTR